MLFLPQASIPKGPRCLQRALGVRTKVHRLLEMNPTSAEWWKVSDSNPALTLKLVAGTDGLSRTPKFWGSSHLPLVPFALFVLPPRCVAEIKPHFLVQPEGLLGRVKVVGLVGVT